MTKKTLLKLAAGAATPGEVELLPGKWTAWIKVTFKVGMFQAVKGMVRFLLAKPGPRPELYASPVNFDPEAPLFPISEPSGYAAELAADLGPYYTTGMVEDHGALANGRIDERAFLDQCAEVWDEREAMMLRELERRESGLFYCLFDTPDRVQHLFWRFREPDHPANRGRNTSKIPSMSSITRIWPSQAGDAPIPIVGTGTISVRRRATGSAVPSTTMAKAPASATALPSAMTRAASASVRPCA